MNTPASFVRLVVNTLVLTLLANISVLALVLGLVLMFATLVTVALDTRR
jgi:hypothetical protein